MLDVFAHVLSPPCLVPARGFLVPLSDPFCSLAISLPVSPASSLPCTPSQLSRWSALRHLHHLLQLSVLFILFY